ncbi:hypothetical protein [Herbaspirillum huttiense]|uniref:Uncharacterized protein n=1 Tax=Herbaspirillum huttiense subsp. lycopersici TaxID=3074428 RepID=A0ABU2EFV0_9BURK|nr:hypothetical protein [Herbaspirillum huttiense]MDR9847022.1 hypothetical protein [Herbaspirillum huttiense SE1]
MTPELFANHIGTQFRAYAAGLLASYLQIQSAGPTPAAISEFRRVGTGNLHLLMDQASATGRELLGLLPFGERSEPRLLAFEHAMRIFASQVLVDLARRLAGGTERMANLLTRDAGAVGLLLQRKLAKPDLTLRDKGGRQWEADKLVAVVARDFAYQAEIDSQANAIEGDLAVVTYPNPHHAGYGRVLSLRGATEGYASFAALRSAIFHPNSTAALRPYVPS